MSAAFVKPTLRGVKPYAIPARNTPGELLLDLNEGASLTSDDWIERIARSVGMDRLRRYPDAAGFESKLANRFDVSTDRVVVTNGGDDAIDRICRVCLSPGDSIVMPSPSFEMIARSGELAGGRVNRVHWMEEAFPTDEVIESCDQSTRLVAVVSPNNPTGNIISAEELIRLSESLPEVLLMVDLAYTEFADVDLTPIAISLPNVVIVRTFSKAYGLAGLRIGYAVGPSQVIDAMRAAGGPFPCSALSIAASEAAMDLPQEYIEDRLKRVQLERDELASLLCEKGAAVLQSQANFVFARIDRAGSFQARLRDHGVNVKRFSDPSLAEYVRIGCPGDEADFDRLKLAIRAVANTLGAS